MTPLRPTPRALVLAALGLLPALLPALGVPYGGLAWAAALGLVVGALAVDLVACPGRGSLRVEVEAPTVLHVDVHGATRRAAREGGAGRRRQREGGLAGEIAAEEMTVTLRLPTRHRLAAEVLPELSSHLAPVAPRRLTLPAGRDGVTVPFPLTPLRRGRAAVEELWVGWSGPLGLVRRTAVVRPGTRVAITPDLGQVRRDALENLTQRNALPGQKLERYLGQGTEFHALREWTAGMERRSVDWKASARHTRLLAREVRAERNHQVVVAVDTGRLMAEPLHGVARLDHAVHAALVLAAVGLRSGDRVGLFAFDDQARAYAPPRSGRDTLASLVETAAGLDYSAAETAFTLALTDLARRLRRRSLVVVLTDFVDSVTADLMVDTLERLARRQLVVFVAFRDPVLGRLANAEPERRRDLDRAVVAGALARDRRRVLARLGRAGVHVVDTEPGAMGPALVDRYLDIKRRELI